MDQLTRLASINCEQHAAAILGRLRLTAGDLEALTEQGFVSGEYRFRGARRYGPFYKLHWRCAGVQHVRYVGRNPVLVEQVRAALSIWQAPRRAQRASAALLRAGRRTLRAAKATAAPQLAREGRYFHGYSVRRRRRHASDQGDDVPTIETHRAREAPQL